MSKAKSKPELKLVEDTGSQLPDDELLNIELPPQQSEMPFAVVEGEPVTQLPRDLYIPPDALQVFLTAFEGPLDLLLYLIRKQNLDILNIPIAEITRQYMEYIDVMADLQLELAGEYLLMAAMLAEIKSRMLLPRPATTEGADEDDPRAELVRRLQEYERFKKAAEDLDRLKRLERDTVPASAELEERTVVARPPDVTLKEMLDAFRDVLMRAEKFAHHHISRERLSQRERMTDILARLQTAAFFEFTQLFKPEEGRMGVTVTFIAILELMKEGLIEIVQAEAYAPIHVRPAQRHLKVVHGGSAAEAADAENVAALSQPELAGENDIPDEDETPPADDASIAVQTAVADVAAASTIAVDSIESDGVADDAGFVEAAVSEALASTETAVESIAAEEAVLVDGAVIEEPAVEVPVSPEDAEAAVREDDLLAAEPAADADELTALADEPAAVAEESTALADATVALADTPAGPTDDTISLVDEPTGLADETSALVDEPTGLADETSALVDEPAGLADDTTSLVDGPADLVDETTALADETSAHVDEASSLADEFAGTVGSPVESVSIDVVDIAEATSVPPAAVVEEHIVPTGDVIEMSEAVDSAVSAADVSSEYSDAPAEDAIASTQYAEGTVDETRDAGDAVDSPVTEETVVDEVESQVAEDNIVDAVASQVTEDNVVGIVESQAAEDDVVDPVESQAAEDNVVNIVEPQTAEEDVVDVTESQVVEGPVVGAVESHVVPEHIVEEHTVEEHVVHEHVVEEHVVPEEPEAEQNIALAQPMEISDAPAVEGYVDTAAEPVEEFAAQVETAEIADEPVVSADLPATDVLVEDAQPLEALEVAGDTPALEAIEVVAENISAEEVTNVLVEDAVANETANIMVEDPAAGEMTNVVIEHVAADETTNVVIEDAEAPVVTDAAEHDEQTEPVSEQTGELSVDDDTVTGSSSEADNSDAEPSR